MEEIERQIMDMLLAGSHPTLAVLREQYRQAAVARREFTGVGVFTHFSVPAETPHTEPPNLTFGDVGFELEGTEHGGSVVLFVRNGVLQLLELFNWTDDWPDTPVLRSLTYMVVTRRYRNGKQLAPSTKRDEAELERELSGPSR